MQKLYKNCNMETWYYNPASPAAKVKRQNWFVTVNNQKLNYKEEAVGVGHFSIFSNMRNMDFTLLFLSQEFKKKKKKNDGKENTGFLFLPSMFSIIFHMAGRTDWWKPNQTSLPPPRGWS